jgi:hypothetical protein
MITQSATNLNPERQCSFPVVLRKAASVRCWSLGSYFVRSQSIMFEAVDKVILQYYVN